MTVFSVQRGLFTEISVEAAWATDSPSFSWEEETALLFYELIFKKRCLGLPSELKLSSEHRAVKLDSRVARILQETAHQIGN
jgi:hypothetical protein